MSEWVAVCDERDYELMGRVARSLDASAEIELVGTSDALRRTVFEAVPGELGAIVGQVDGGVADVNLAAAIAHDGNARRVVLARHGVSGSLRSRAARAGIDDVVDLDEGDGGPGGGVSASDGGRLAQGSDCPPGPSARLSPGREGAAVLTFCSGRGGVGKTSIVAAFAAQAQRWGVRACMLDLDLSCGNLFSCFGLPRGTDLSRLAEGGDLEWSASGLSVAVTPLLGLAGPCERPESAELVSPYVAKVISALARECDLLLVDTSTTLTDAAAQAAQLADRLVIVSDDRPGGAAALARVGGLAVRLGVARTRIARLENRASPRRGANLALGRAEVGLEVARVYRAFDGGGEAVDLLAEGLALELPDSGGPFAESVAISLAQMLAELGRLPACEEAARAAEGSTAHRRPTLFGLRREAR